MPAASHRRGALSLRGFWPVTGPAERCRSCGKFVPRREALRLSIVPERVDPSREKTLTCSLCENCAGRIARSVLALPLRLF